MALYNAPVVKERYKRVISHFNKPKNSLANGQKLDPIIVKSNNLSGQDGGALSTAVDDG